MHSPQTNALQLKWRDFHKHICASDKAQSLSSAQCWHRGEGMCNQGDAVCLTTLHHSGWKTTTYPSSKDISHPHSLRKVTSSVQWYCHRTKSDWLVWQHNVIIFTMLSFIGWYYVVDKLNIVLLIGHEQKDYRGKDFMFPKSTLSAPDVHTYKHLEQS